MIRTQRTLSPRQLCRFTLIAGLLGAGLSVVPARADGLEPTYAQRVACTPDAFRLCSDQIPDASAVKACMIAKKSQLSSGCRAMFNKSVASR